MARTVNKVILVGRLGADPDVRYAASGTAVAKFSVATNEAVQGADGNWEEKTEWHRVVVFGKTAEHCGNYLSKGRLVYIEGRLRTNQWEDQQGVKRYTTEIVARDVVFLGGQGDQPMQQAQSRQSDFSTGYRSAPAEPSFNEELPPPPGPHEDDIPF